MNEDKLNAFEAEIDQNAQTDESRVVRDIVFVRDLITAYRQLEKDKNVWAFNSLIVIKKIEEDNAELLAALKDVRDIAELNEHWSISRIRKLSGEAYNKHKGE